MLNLRLKHYFMLFLLSISYVYFIYGREYMCINGEKKVRTICGKTIHEDFCNACPMNNNTSNVDWCFCGNDTSLIALYNGECTLRDNSLNAPIITSPLKNNSLIVSNSTNQPTFLTVSYEKDILSYKNVSEYIETEVNCSFGGSLFVINVHDPNPNECLKNYVYEYVHEGDHMILMPQASTVVNIFASSLSMELYDSVSFYGETCTFGSRVKRAISVPSTISNLYGVKIKPMAAPFTLQILDNETEELLEKYDKEEPNMNFTNVYLYVSQVNDTKLEVMFDTSRYSLLTMPMSNVMYYKLGLSNMSSEMKHNISTVYRLAKMIIEFTSIDNSTVKEIVLSTPNETVTNFSE